MRHKSRPEPHSPAVPASTPAEFQAANAFRAAGALRTVLLLEDHDSMAELLNTSLGRHGFEVTRVANGAEGLKCILASDYGVILCDMVMPGFPGDMFYRAVERVRPYLCARFIFMTGHVGDGHIVDFVRSVNGILIWKPFQMESLVELVQAVVKAQEAAAQPALTPAVCSAWIRALRSTRTSVV